MSIPTAAAGSGDGRFLELNEIRVNYGVIRALKGISLRVDQGEVVTLIGANGAGKSTTVRTIAGIHQPASGRIRLQGKDITTVGPEHIVLLGICLVPEGRHIFPRMSVYENLLMGAFTSRNKRLIEEDMERVFALFPRLKERRDQLGGTLSGGEQQMLAIGRALMARPKILMLDEPSLGLAPILVETIFEIIRDINSQGTTILLVEQNAHKALGVAHRGYVLETGTIVKEGTGKQLMESPDVQKAYLGI
jgi:branched-chain amino acid transport system ATP-binding protein